MKDWNIVIQIYKTKKNVGKKNKKKIKKFKIL